ncbi:MAG: hypothetical protein K0S66_3022 [Sphingomonas sp.]|nr:hypothetical protein [Sphingomonas sp.]
MVPFRELPWGQQSPPPWGMPGATLRGFALRASMPTLQTWCDDTLNGVSSDSFVPAFPVVFLYLVHYPKLVASGHEELGFSTQNEFFLMMPVLRLFAPFVPLELGWAFPFIGVDNGTSAISGQMVVGLAKTLGEIDINEAGDGSYAANVSMLALTTFSPDTQQMVQPLLAIAANDPDPSATAIAGGFPGSVLHIAEIKQELSSEAIDLTDLPLTPASALASGCFALRQIRDCGAPAEAALADIVRMHWRSENERDFRFWGDVAVDVFDNATFPITDALGLIGGVPLPIGGLRYSPIASWGVTADLCLSARVLD